MLIAGQLHRFLEGVLAFFDVYGIVVEREHYNHHVLGTHGVVDLPSLSVVFDFSENIDLVSFPVEESCGLSQVKNKNGDCWLEEPERVEETVF